MSRTDDLPAATVVFLTKGGDRTCLELYEMSLNTAPGTCLLGVLSLRNYNSATSELTRQNRAIAFVGLIGTRFHGE